MFVASDSRLLPGERRVVGGYSGIKYHIRPSGTWVWKPDAEEILKLQELAACRGGTVKNPFGITTPSRKMRRAMPTEAPKL